MSQEMMQKYREYSDTNAVDGKFGTMVVSPVCYRYCIGGNCTEIHCL